MTRLHSAGRQTARALVAAVALGATVAAAAAFAAPAMAEETAPADPNSGAVAQLRQEIEALKAQLQALQDRLEAMAKAQLQQPSLPVQEPPAQEPAPSAPRAAASAGNVFNPAISAVFQGIGDMSVNHNRDEDGFALSEAEIGLQAVVDPYARVDLFVAFSAEGEAEVEEGYATFQTLPAGLQAKAGRFKSAFGKWNQLHNHAFFTVERPEVLSSFFGEESLTDDGASLSWLIPGTGSAYIESVSEVGSTPNDVSFNARRRDLLYLQRLSSVFTLTPNATLEIGGSGAFGRGGPSETLLAAIDDAGLTGVVEPATSLTSNVFGADLTFKWKPVQFNVYRSATWQTEALQSIRRVEDLDPTGVLVRRTVRSVGGYTYAEYQFAKRWRTGVRLDYTEFPDDDRARVHGASGIVRVQPTEFQEFRLQFKHTGRNDLAAARFDDTRTDNEFLIEWIPVIGAHAAHKY